MDVSPPCSSAPFQPAGVTGVTCEVFRHLRVPPGLGSLGGFRFPRRFAGVGRTQGARDGSRRVGRVVWSFSGSSGETLGCGRNVIRAIPQRLCSFFVDGLSVRFPSVNSRVFAR